MRPAGAERSRIDPANLHVAPPLPLLHLSVRVFSDTRVFRRAVLQSGWTEASICPLDAAAQTETSLLSHCVSVCVVVGGGLTMTPLFVSYWGGWGGCSTFFKVDSSFTPEVAVLASGKRPHPLRRPSVL